MPTWPARISRRSSETSRSSSRIELAHERSVQRHVLGDELGRQPQVPARWLARSIPGTGAGKRHSPGRLDGQRSQLAVLERSGHLDRELDLHSNPTRGRPSSRPRRVSFGYPHRRSPANLTAAAASPRDAPAMNRPKRTKQKLIALLAAAAPVVAAILVAMTPARTRRLAIGRRCRPARIVPRSTRSRERDMDCDVAVLGGGPGGYTAAIRAAQLGARTVCIEKEPELGGTCLRVGCIPTKAWVQTAYAIHEAAENFAKFGVQVERAKLDMATANVWKDGVVKQMTLGRRVPVQGLRRRMGEGHRPLQGREHDRGRGRGGRDVQERDRRHGLVPAAAADPRARLAELRRLHRACSRRPRCRRGSSSSAAGSSAASSPRSSSASAPR